MNTRAVVVRADRNPMAGIENPGTHQTYRNPRIAVENRQLGELRDDEIRVQVLYAGICGTDLHLVATDPETGYVRCSAPAVIDGSGRIIGHEAVARIVATGSRVEHLKPAGIVTFESIITCRHCEVCRRGQFNQCLSARLLGLETDGLFADIVDVPGMLAHDVTAFAQTEKELKAAACIEPAGVAYVACENTRIAPGDSVVVFGAGPIGAFAAMFSKLIFGASRVWVVEPVRFRRSLASRWGDEAMDVQEFFDNVPSRVDVVIEASGYTDNVRRIFRRLNPNGRIALLGRSGTPLMLDAVDHMITNAISIVGSRGHLCGAFSKILKLAMSKRIDLDQIVTEIVDGPEGVCSILGAPERIADNCKVLARFNGGDRDRRDELGIGADGSGVK